MIDQAGVCVRCNLRVPCGPGAYHHRASYRVRCVSPISWIRYVCPCIVPHFPPILLRSKLQSILKILLLGEFSGLHNNLKSGLCQLGHQAIVAAAGDGFKKIPADIRFEQDWPGILSKVYRQYSPLWHLNELRGFDVVQLMNAFSFYGYGFPARWFYKRIRNRNEKMFMLAAGDDAYCLRYAMPRLKYEPFSEFLKYDLKKSHYYKESAKSMRFNTWLVDLVDGIIPVMYEYELGYQGSLKRLKTIPIPMDLKAIKYEENRVIGRLRVFHGLNRYGFKGTRHVEEAFEYLRAKYPNDLELTIGGGVPLSVYLQWMRRANVIVDQMYSYSLGVNGVYALAMGKVVVGGAEPESLRSMGIERSPVINVTPSATSLIAAVEGLLAKRDSIAEQGWLSRLYAEEVHDCVKVARQYVAEWNGVVLPRNEPNRGLAFRGY